MDPQLEFQLEAQLKLMVRKVSNLRRSQRQMDNPRRE